MSEPTKDPQTTPEVPVMDFADFLANHPPGSLVRIGELIVRCRNAPDYFKVPAIEIFCGDEKCRGLRFFDSKERSCESDGFHTFCHLYFTCRHCRTSPKVISLLVDASAGGGAAECWKLGELPPFGPHIPPKVIRLVEPDRELFFKGIRAESLSLGIGAFGYYRRVIENQKDRLLDEILKVSQKLNASAELVEELKQAKMQYQFSNAVNSIKHALPAILLINGHNPLLLLHNALSKGLHNMTDAECLQSATDVRTVLFELAERLKLAVKDDREIREALSRLANPGAASPTGKASE